MDLPLVAEHTTKKKWRLRLPPGRYTDVVIILQLWCQTPPALSTGLIEFRWRTPPRGYPATQFTRINISNLFTSFLRAEFYIMCFIVYGTGYIHKARIVFRNTILVFIEETKNNANGGCVLIYSLLRGSKLKTPNRANTSWPHVIFPMSSITVNQTFSPICKLSWRYYPRFE